MEEAGRIRRGYFVDGLGAAQFALPGAVDRLRAMRDQPGELAGDRGRVVQLLAAADPANPYGAALPWPRRGDADRRPFQRAAGAYVALVDGAAVLYLDRGGTSIQTLPAADDAEALGAALSSLRDLVVDGRVRELVIAKVDGEPVARLARSATRSWPRGFAAGVPRVRAPSGARPAGALRPCPRATRSPAPPRDCVRTSSAARSRGLGRRAPGPQVDRLVGSTVTAVDAMGKNLLIRFDNGLEVRTHLRMRGSWHRYRPGERVAPAAGSRASLVIEVPGSVAVCFDAPVVELFEQRTEALHPSLSRLGPDLLADPVDVDEAMRRLHDPSRDDLSIAEALLDQRAMAGIGNEVKNLVLWEASLSPWTRLRDVDDAALRRLIERAAAVLREGAATGRRPAGVHGRAGRPCPRCGTIVQAKEQGRELPRLTYWCPACQPDDRSGDQALDTHAGLSEPGDYAGPIRPSRRPTGASPRGPTAATRTPPLAPRAGPGGRRHGARAAERHASSTRHCRSRGTPSSSRRPCS